MTAIEKFLEKIRHRCMEEPNSCLDIDCPFSQGKKCKIVEYAAELEKEVQQDAGHIVV